MKKKILAAGAAMMAVVSLATVNAFAAKKYYSFSVETNQNDGVAFSARNIKSDNDQFARIKVEDHNLASNDSFWMCVCSTYRLSGKVTNWKKVTPDMTSSYFDITYNTTRSNGSSNWLCADTDQFYVTIDGYWWS